MGIFMADAATMTRVGSRKGARSTLGYKGFARVDGEGYTERVHITPASRGESLEFGRMG